MSQNIVLCKQHMSVFFRKFNLSVFFPCNAKQINARCLTPKIVLFFFPIAYERTTDHGRD